MDRTLVDFVKALRTAEVKVSPAETLDAMHCMDIVGYEDREFLKNSLSIVLSKNPEEKEAFDSCFDRFFTFEKFAPSIVDELDEPMSDDGDAGDEGDFDPNREGGQRTSGRGGQGGGGGAQGEDEEDDISETEISTLTPSSRLGQLLMSGDRTELTIAMAEAGREVEVSQIVVFTQKGLYTRKIMEAMGLKELQEEIGDLQSHGGRPQKVLSNNLKKGRDQLREKVRDYVEKQFFLHADEQGKQLREELLKKVKLSNLEKRNFKDVQEVVFKMAKKLIAIHSKRRKTYRRGQVDIRRTLRNNMQYDGMLFDIKWKSSKVDRPKVMCICDVSGSVSNYSRFLLMFLYSLAEILPKVRSFAFSSDLGEVTDMFECNDLEDAMSKTMRDYGNGSTDYGQMLVDFKNHCLNDVNNKTTIIILGDARNNYGDPKSEILREVYDRAKRVIWLNPEPRMSWTVGDAEMRKYAPCCHQVEVCNSLVHLERVVANLLRSVS
jgi:uncharacterized protein with von Willebrand factor type A (vWA) domain